MLIDRICASVADHLAPEGAVLIVQSTINGEDETCALLEEAGLEADVAYREEGEFGPLMTRMAPELESRGLIAVGQRTEEVVVVRGRKPA